VERIALNMDQIDQYEPPPNPAKMTDSRATGYVDEYGTSSWELDALEPRVLVGLVRHHVEEVMDPLAWEEATDAQEIAQDALRAVGLRWDEVVSHLGVRR
jgi:hypothetical protein